MKLAAALASSVVAALVAARASAQACCAGSSAVTPGRLELHESMLVGAEVKAGAELGSFDAQGAFRGNPAGASELDFEQDLFAAVRVFRRAQLAWLLPFVETRRTSAGVADFGGGVGDVNASARYDLTLAGSSRFVPGVALLAGVTFPTGRPPDARGIGPLAAGATGIGALQLNAGVALEQLFGDWLVSLSGIVAVRASRSVGAGALAVDESLAPQWTVLAAVAHTFRNDAAVAASASFAAEGDATVDGASVSGTARRTPTLSLAGSWPFSDVLRGQLVIFDNPPLPSLGANQPSDLGVSVVLVRSWL